MFPVPTKKVYDNSEVELQCYAKSDQEVLKWLNSLGGSIRSLSENPDPSRPVPSLLLDRLKERAEILRGVLEKRGFFRNDRGNVLEKKRKLSQETYAARRSSIPTTPTCEKKKPSMVTKGTQTDECICFDCGFLRLLGHPCGFCHPSKEEEEEFVVPKADENYIFNTLGC